MANTKTYTYTLPSNAQVYIEAEASEDETAEFGTKEIFRSGNQENLSFSQIIAPLGEVAQVMFEAIKTKVVTPDEITLEFGANLKGGVNLFLVSGKTDAT
jgi:hypothetical protein